MAKTRVGILGATGAVGQMFIRLLEGHPWFEVTALAASERSAGKSYLEAVNWTQDCPIPDYAQDIKVQTIDPVLDCDLVFSALSANIAGDAEAAFANAGYPVISNARNYRMDGNVPLLIPEINPDHLDLIDNQNWEKGGYIVTNPNCATMGLAIALKPLHDAFELESVIVTTMQAVSGAGYPGVASLDILGNVIPYIGGEEEKLASETQKILGTLFGSGILPAEFKVSAQCNRVPVINGHMECVSIKFKKPVDVQGAKDCLADFVDPVAELGLPSSPKNPVQVLDNPNYPQPRVHAGLGNGMTVSVGRIREDEVLDIKMIVLSHNTIRGAAGAAVLNAELLVSKGRVGEE